MKEKFLFGGEKSTIEKGEKMRKRKTDGSLSVGFLFDARGDIFLKKVSEGRRSLFRHI